MQQQPARTQQANPDEHLTSSPDAERQQTMQGAAGMLIQDARHAQACPLGARCDAASRLQSNRQRQNNCPASGARLAASKRPPAGPRGAPNRALMLYLQHTAHRSLANGSIGPNPQPVHPTHYAARSLEKQAAAHALDGAAGALLHQLHTAAAALPSPACACSAVPEYTQARLAQPRVARRQRHAARLHAVVRAALGLGLSDNVRLLPSCVICGVATSSMAYKHA